jgi:hypothetical protein
MRVSLNGNFPYSSQKLAVLRLYSRDLNLGYTAQTVWMGLIRLSPGISPLDSFGHPQGIRIFGDVGI